MAYALLAVALVVALCVWVWGAGWKLTARIWENIATSKGGTMQIKPGQKVSCRRCCGNGIETRYRAGDDAPVEIPAVCVGCNGTGEQEVIADVSGTRENRYEPMSAAAIVGS